MKSILLLLALLCNLSLYSQSPGLIILPPGGMGVTPLNPNGDGFSSVLPTGYLINDITESEIVYQPLPVPYAEPTSDLARGADCNFSDIVRIDSFDSGVYMFSDATNLLFRFRQGNTVPGSKGYSILIDTDMKFGCCGPDADPNYIPKTTGINGNPGFEIEIVLETNFQVAMYNVDGIDNPSIPDVTYSIVSNHQRSVALTNNCDNPDYFHDFYIVLADLYSTFGITSSTPLRYAATTVMAPKPALGGPLSDINGGGSYEDIIFYQCGTPIGTVPTAAAPCSCTNPPTINGPIPSGTNVPITGNWTVTSSEKPKDATIEVFINGSSQGTVATTDGAGWGMALPGPLVNGDTIYATAQATGEGICDPDPQIIIVSDCNTLNQPTTPTITCVGAKGMKGTSDPNAIINIWLYLAPPASPTEALQVSITADATGAWGWDGLALVNNTISNICTAGSGDMVEGTYKVVADTGNCPSAPASICLDRNGGSFSLSGSSTEPVITSDPIVEGTSDISGTAVTGETVRLYVNGFFKQSVIATAGTFTFVGVSPLSSGDVVGVTAQADLACESTAASQTISCTVAAPSIDANADDEVEAGVVLTGTSAENGATVDIYDVSAPAVSLGTAVVSGGTWTSAVVAVAGVSYFAKVTSSCGSSEASLRVTALGATPNRCGVFTNTPYDENTGVVTGTLSTAVAGTVVNLYIDGAFAGTTTTNSTAWSVVVPSPELYGGAVLTFGVQEPGLMEFRCPVTEIVQCTSPPPFTFSPATFIVPSLGGTATFTLSGTTAGILYVIENLAAPNEDLGVSVFSTGTDFDLVTFPFFAEGEYDIQIRGMKFSGVGCELAMTSKITVLNPLPVELLFFDAELVGNNKAKLSWSTATELDNKGYVVEHAKPSFGVPEFKNIGFVTGNGTTLITQNYSFDVEKLISGTHYFRLKQIDYDGTFSYTETKALEVSNSIQEDLYPTLLSGGNQSIFVKVAEKDNYLIEIISPLGQIVHLHKGIMDNGQYFEVVFDTNRYSSGIYIIRVSTDSSHFTRKVRIEK